MDVAAGGDKQRGQLRWYKEFTYPAPTFRLVSKAWPLRDNQPLPAEVKLWWSPAEYPSNENFTYQFEWARKLDKEPKVVGSTWFKIEGVDPEPHEVSDTPWNGER